MANIKPVAKATQRKNKDSKPKAKATPMTHARAQAMLDEKNAKIGNDKYAYAYGGFLSAVKGHPSRTYVYAYAGTKQTPTIFWAKGDVLSARTRKHAREERLAVRNELDKAGAWVRP